MVNSSSISPKSPVLLHQKPANSMTNRPSITWFETPYMTVKDLYTRFHGKPRPSSLTPIQNRLPHASPTGQQMRPRQMRIISYFKPAANNPTNQAKLAPNRKHADLIKHGKSARINDLASRISYSPSTTLHTCRRCTQHFTSRNMLHRHLRHCSSCIKRWSFANNTFAGTLTGGRYPSNCTNNLSFSLLAHAG